MILCFETLRIIHSSDTHGWLWHNPHNLTCNAGFAGILAFIRQSKENNPNTFAFDSGDMIQGNGLSDADETTPIGTFVYQMWSQALAQKPSYYDCLTLGNHDLQLENTLPELLNNYLRNPGMHSNFVATNTYFINKSSNPTFRWKRVHNGEYSTLVTGFMYPFTPKDPLEIHNMNILFEQDQSLKSLILNENPDFITVLVHFGVFSSLDKIFSVYHFIRQFTDKPLIILGGHEHQTYYEYNISLNQVQSILNKNNKTVNYNWRDIILPKENNDNFDINFIIAQSISYFQNITLLDIEFEDTTTITGSKIIKSVKFQETLTNTTVLEQNIMGKNLTLNKFETQLNNTIYDKVEQLNLTEIVGYAPQDYIRCNDKLEDNCMFSLWFQQICPQILFKSDNKITNKIITFQGKSFILNNGIIKGQIYKNDLYLTLPYRDEYFFIFKNMIAKDLKLIYSAMGDDYFDYPQIEDLTDNEIVDLIVTDYDMAYMEIAMNKIDIQYSQDKFGNMTPFEVYRDFVAQYWQNQ